MPPFFVAKERCKKANVSFVLNPNVRFENTYKYLHFIWAVKPQGQRKYKENTKKISNHNMLTFANMMLGNARNIP